MVSADNLNLDCLELIFAYLSGNDLVSVSLVSRSFLAAVIPRLYRTLTFGLKQAKRYPSITSPFAAVLAHNDLASHVRNIDLRAVPTAKFLPQAKFMDDCTRTVAACKNLGSFICTMEGIMPSFLLALQEKGSLEHLRIPANFTADQAAQLARVSGLRALTLDTGSWNVVDILPRWSHTLTPTLTSFTLTSVQTLSPDIMEIILPNLPLLTSLHVINCPKVDQSAVLRLLAHTPQLHSLAFTSYESARAIPSVVSPLPHLRHLAIDTQCAPTPGNSTPTLWASMINLTHIWTSPLKSLSLRLSDKIILGEGFVSSLVSNHQATLTHLSLRNCALSRDSMLSICRQCKGLETLKLAFPAKEITGVIDALALAKCVHTISDIGDLHSSHSSRAPLQKNEIRMLMLAQPALERIVADGRTWSAVRSPGKDELELHVKKNGPSLRHWFMPPASVVGQA